MFLSKREKASSILKQTLNSFYTHPSTTLKFQRLVGLMFKKLPIPS